MSSTSVCVRRRRNLLKHCGENEPVVNIHFGAIAKRVDKAA